MEYQMFALFLAVLAIAGWAFAIYYHRRGDARVAASGQERPVCEAACWPSVEPSGGTDRQETYRSISDLQLRMAGADAFITQNCPYNTGARQFLALAEEFLAAMKAAGSDHNWGFVVCMHMHGVYYVELAREAAEEYIQALSYSPPQPGDLCSGTL